MDEEGIVSTYPEHKLDAYVFIGSGDTNAFERLKELGREDGGIVRYATPLLSGSYGALAFVEVDDPDDLAELERKLGLIRDRVNPPPTDTGIKLKPGAQAPTRWSPKPPIAAFVRVRVERGQADAVLSALNGIAHYWGSAIVAGSFDILLELAGESLTELQETLLTRLHEYEGIVSTDTAFALNKPRETWAD